MTRIFTALLLCFVLGCGGSDSGGSSDADAPKPTDSLKSTLSSIAQTGEVGSAEAEIQDAIAQIRESDPALADELQAKVKPLYGGSPARVKKAAEELVKEL